MKEHSDMTNKEDMHMEQMNQQTNQTSESMQSTLKELLTQKLTDEGISPEQQAEILPGLEAGIRFQQQLGRLVHDLDEALHGPIETKETR